MKNCVCLYGQMSCGVCNGSGKLPDPEIPSSDLKDRPTSQGASLEPTTPYLKWAFAYIDWKKNKYKLENPPYVVLCARRVVELEEMGVFGFLPLYSESDVVGWIIGRSHTIFQTFEREDEIAPGELERFRTNLREFYRYVDGFMDAEDRRWSERGTAS